MDLKSCKTSKGCVEMVIPWQLCWTIGPLTFHSQEMWLLYDQNMKTFSESWLSEWKHEFWSFEKIEAENQNYTIAQSQSDYILTILQQTLDWRVFNWYKSKIFL